MGGRGSELGSGMAEYAIILVLVLGVAAAAVTALGQGQASTLAAAGGIAQLGGDIASFIDDFESWVNGHGPHDWQYFWGNWFVNDEGTLASNAQWAKAILDVGVADFDYTVDLKTDEIAGQDIWDVTRVVFRWQDTRNYYALVPKTDGVLELAKMQNGRWVPWLAAANVGVDPTQWNTYRVSVVGNSVRVYFNGQLVINYFDVNPILGTGVGVTNDQSWGQIDNVVVQPTPPSSPAQS
ncbi:MAG: hypothetical protein Kow0047_08350 [Anaerolineae bacterium]